MSNVEPSRDAWLANRKNGIGASEWAAALGLHPTVSPFQLALEKQGKVEPANLDDQEDIEFGKAMEPVSLGFLAKRTGREVMPWPQDEMAVSEEKPFLFATPDAIQIDSDKGRGVVETKNRNEWSGREWKGSPPLLVQIQLQAQAFVLGLEWGTICAVIGGHKFRSFDVDRNDNFIASAVKGLERFWDLVCSDKTPDIDATKSCSVSVAKLYPDANGLSVALPPAFKQDFAELTALKRFEKAIKNRKQEIETRVKAAIGENEIGLLDDGSSFSWREQSRVVLCKHCGEAVSDSEFRVLRQHDCKTSSKHSVAAMLAYATAVLIAQGATLVHQSKSGSRYIELAGGLQLRIADHDPNDATEGWMGRNEVASIRVDQPDWKDQLQTIVGPLNLE